MPGKHVHFVDVPSTPPSATFSASSVQDSPGPATPPQMFYQPYPANSSYRSVLLHPLLAPPTFDGAPLSWVLSQPADHALPNLPYGPPHLTDALLSEPATHLPLSSLAIVSDYLPWTITVAPTPNAIWYRPYVTVGDVLHALYRSLRLAVTEQEMHFLEPAQQDRVRDAYIRRYRRIQDPHQREREKAKSVKRIDFLRDLRSFLGLSLVPGGLPAKGLPPGSVWALHVARA